MWSVDTLLLKIMSSEMKRVRVSQALLSSQDGSDTFMLLNVSYFQTQSFFWRSPSLPLFYQCNLYVTTLIP